MNDPALPDEAADTAAAGTATVSPWYRRAVMTFAVYFVAVVAFGTAAPFESDLAWALLSLAVWVPFGAVFTACVHFDLRAVRAAGVDWGRTRYLYYLSVLVPKAAVFYLLFRYTKVARARQQGRFDGTGGDSAGHGADPSERHVD